MWDLTFDMSGGPKGAKRPLARPLDGGVRLPRSALEERRDRCDELLLVPGPCETLHRCQCASADVREQADICETGQTPRHWRSGVSCRAFANSGGEPLAGGRAARTVGGAKQQCGGLSNSDLRHSTTPTVQVGQPLIEKMPSSDLKWHPSLSVRTGTQRFLLRAVAVFGLRGT